MKFNSLVSQMKRLRVRETEATQRSETSWGQCSFLHASSLPAAIAQRLAKAGGMEMLSESPRHLVKSRNLVI